MKTLLVLRHAKSSWDRPELPDSHRPLNKRGERTAPFMGSLIDSIGLVPDAVISSPAARARMTAEKAVAAGEFDVEIEFDERIYGAGARELLEIVSEIGDDAGSALIVGHNPGFQMLVQLLTNEGPRMRWEERRVGKD